MENEAGKIKGILEIIGKLKSQFGVKRNSEACEPLMFVGVAETDIISGIVSIIEDKFGKPYKPAGETAFFKNFFDGFVKNIGGIRREQTLFRKDISPSMILFCAFWPWGSEPVKTSIRIGLLCYSDAECDEISKLLKGCFQ